MKKKLVKWLPVILWMIVIFIFSSENGIKSGENNKFVIDLLKHIGINLDKDLGGNANFIVRKFAHMTEYFILFLLVYRAINEKFSFIKTLIFSLIFVFLYASSDEYHQSFIPGRGPSVRDVMIDTSGGTIALLATVLATRKKRYDWRKSIFKKR